MAPAVWRVGHGPESVNPQGADATLWRWWLINLETSLAASVIVKISGTAMAVAPEHLPMATRRARETYGRSEVDQVLDWWNPPQLIELHTHSQKGERIGGSGEPPPEGHVEYERRIAGIEQWFRERGIGLWFDRAPDDTWRALVVSGANRVGIAVVGTGATQLEAADNAQRAYLGRSESVVSEGTAEHTLVEEVRPTDDEIFAMPKVDVPAEIREEEERLAAIAADFAWRIAFGQEPDGAWFWVVHDDVTNEPIKGGQAATWEDALLAAIEDLKPPSGEA